MIEFTVYGRPRPQGSKIAHAIYDKQGRPVMKNGRVVVVARNADKNLLGWRNQLAAAAVAAYDGELILGPISLKVLFVRPRPKGHFGTGRNRDILKSSAPEYPIARPDTLKLARAVEDALTGVIWKDDSQIVVHRLEKRYGAKFETRVTIIEL